MLISLAVLGLIAALTLPSVFNNIAKAKRVAVLKETQQILQDVLTSGIQSGNIQPGDGLGPITQANRSYIRSKLNAIKVCPTNPVAERCLGSVANTMDPHTESFLSGSGYAQILPNGVTVSSGGNGVASGQLLVIDVNNISGPNTVCLNTLVHPVGT
ncbi:MAG: hypothetical protein ACKO34_01140, partial [Vampirovibrionales bacterium]